MNKETAKEYILWLKSNYQHSGEDISVYIFGSSLHKSSPSDVDIIQVFNTSLQQSEIKEFIYMVKYLRKSFEDRFGLPLHITTFTVDEKSDFNKFMSKNNFQLIL